MNAGTALLTTTGSEVEAFPSSFSAVPRSAPAQPEALLLDQLRSSIPEMRQSFLSALPWPHLVLDDLIDPVAAATAEKQETALATQLRPHRSHRMVKAESSVPGGPAATAILADMLSPRFIALLEGVTGIRHLIGDPKHFAGGLHVSGRGAFQSVHTDFERHSVPGLYHRVNVLLYLNSEWEADFGGELELWPKDMTECGRKIAPLLGRIVIFATDPNTVHGVPDPVQCPPDRYRLSLASYYYTTEQPQLISFRDRIVQAQRPQDPWWRSISGPSNAVGGLRRLGQRLSGPPSGPSNPAT